MKINLQTGAVDPSVTVHDVHMRWRENADGCFVSLYTIAGNGGRGPLLSEFTVPGDVYVEMGRTLKPGGVYDFVSLNGQPLRCRVLTCERV